eukprot:gene6813-biopygen20935
MGGVPPGQTSTEPHRSWGARLIVLPRRASRAHFFCLFVVLGVEFQENPGALRAPTQRWGGRPWMYVAHIRWDVGARPGG